MKISASIGLVMQFATYEAITGRFGEIEPEHLFIGILKTAEVPTEELDRLAAGAAAARQIVAEIDAVRKELNSRRIDGKRVRCELRGKLGRGNSAYAGGRVHRSQGCRRIFDTAARKARDAGAEVLVPKVILEVMLVSPTQLIRQVLGEDVGKEKERRVETVLLDKHGGDLTKAAEGRQPADSGHLAASRVLVEFLKARRRMTVLLISDNEGAVRSTVTAAANAMTKEDSPELKAKRIIDLTGLDPSAGWDAQMEKKFNGLFAESAAQENVILFLPAIKGNARNDVSDDWPGFLRKELTRTSFQCICQVVPSVYESRLRKDSVWRHLAHVIWIHGTRKDGIPGEL